MQLNLVKGGIFPIKNNLDNDSTGFKTSGTFQGEGKLLGTACLFIRTSACNLRCAWIGLDGKGSLCDTPYSSHNPEKNKMDIDEIINTVIVNTQDQNIKHVVISGGEPTMQTEALEELLLKLRELGYYTTIETNATIYSENIGKYTNLVSMSPKLSSSTPWESNLKDTGVNFNQKWAERHERDRINIPVIQEYINVRNKYNNDFQLKFVVTNDKDIQEIEDILNQLEGWEPSDICLMPEGVDVNTLNTRTGWAAEQALIRGWRFTPRLHIMMFGKNRYV
jgi:7-carboxy-7-deazaguanine synthase